MYASPSRSRCIVWSAVNVCRVSTLANALRAEIGHSPVEIAVSSRSNVPPGGFGVLLVMPAACKALVL